MAQPAGVPADGEDVEMKEEQEPAGDPDDDMVFYLGEDEVFSVMALLEDVAEMANLQILRLDV